MKDKGTKRKEKINTGMMGTVVLWINGEAP
jgi:hypothetical protein